MAGTAQDSLFLTQIEAYFNTGASSGAIPFSLSGIISNYVNTTTDGYNNAFLGFTGNEFGLKAALSSSPDPTGSSTASNYSTGTVLAFTGKLLAVTNPAESPPYVPIINQVISPPSSTVAEWMKVFSSNLKLFSMMGKPGNTIANKYLALGYLAALKKAIQTVTTEFTSVHSIVGTVSKIPGSIS